MKSSLIRKFGETIDENGMLTRGDSVLIALSGGIDSTVMTHLFCEIRKKYDLKLYAFHLNHKLRAGEAEDEAVFVKKLCENLGIKAFIREYGVKGYADDNKLSVQVAARDIRYRMLGDIRDEYNIDKIATAHNADDRVETVLIKMVRGTAGANISGIAPVRDGQVIRPLIDAYRSEIEAYAKENDISFMEDSSNLKTDYLRNRVRHDFIPYLKENYNKNIKEGILQFSKVAKDEDDYIGNKAKEIYCDALLHGNEREISLSIPALAGAEKVFVNRVLMMAYYHLAPLGKVITYKHIAKINYIIKSGRPNLSYDLPGDILVYKSYQTLQFTLNTGDCVDYEYVHNLNGFTDIREASIRVKSERIEVTDFNEVINSRNPNEEFVDAVNLGESVIIRNFRAGDLIQPLNMYGHSKKLKDIFIDRKMPLVLRRTVPILTANDEIFLIPNICVSEKFRVSSETKYAVKFIFS